uniref:Uncharacterized protein n=1 Tax=Oryza sativa subsp. japonica TaxID=39947 RepID=Q6H495_ORYSJ|nr:hypothetical protein [Oryza sativa Japonica Group]
MAMVRELELMTSWSNSMGRHRYPTRILVDSFGHKCSASDKGVWTSCSIRAPLQGRGSFRRGANIRFGRYETTLHGGALGVTLVCAYVSCMLWRMMVAVT